MSLHDSFITDMTAPFVLGDHALFTAWIAIDVLDFRWFVSGDSLDDRGRRFILYDVILTTADVLISAVMMLIILYQWMSAMTKDSAHGVLAYAWRGEVALQMAIDSPLRKLAFSMLTFSSPYTLSAVRGLTFQVAYTLARTFKADSRLREESVEEVGEDGVVRVGADKPSVSYADRGIKLMLATGVLGSVFFLSMAISAMLAGVGIGWSLISPSWIGMPGALICLYSVVLACFVLCMFIKGSDPDCTRIFVSMICTCLAASAFIGIRLLGTFAAGFIECFVGFTMSALTYFIVGFSLGAWFGGGDGETACKNLRDNRDRFFQIIFGEKLSTALSDAYEGRITRLYVFIALRSFAAFIMVALPVLRSCGNAMLLSDYDVDIAGNITDFGYKRAVEATYMSYFHAHWPLLFLGFHFDLTIFSAIIRKFDSALDICASLTMLLWVTRLVVKLEAKPSMPLTKVRRFAVRHMHAPSWVRGRRERTQVEAREAPNPQIHVHRSKFIDGIQLSSAATRSDSVGHELHTTAHL